MLHEIPIVENAICPSSSLARVNTACIAYIRAAKTGPSVCWDKITAPRDVAEAEVVQAKRDCYGCSVKILVK